ncbi:MAG: type IV toxin-antitoxin system AbiEi family antitoxin [Propionibacteriaceae bacterium]|nr:type IV toxin-antitoxin system AbiEi family antitoxin [Propionibacteriaceae bacterium]
MLEQLELDRPELVTTNMLADLLQAQGIGTAPRVVAARLRERGWLLPTPQRGVWEFAPAEVAGPYSRHDPVMPLLAYLTRHPNAECALTFQAAAWARQRADRAPTRLEVAVGSSRVAATLPSQLDPSVFTPALEPEMIRQVPVLAAESVLINMTTKPSDVRSWESAREWLPELAAELRLSELQQELAHRPKTVTARTGYLLSAMRPDLAEALTVSAPATVTWFGPREHVRRRDRTWMIVDTLLPFDPKTLEAAS